MTSYPVTVPVPLGKGRETLQRAHAREALVKTLWDKNKNRKIPSEKKLVKAISDCHPSDLWWVCEMNSVSPVYLLLTRPFLKLLAQYIQSLKIRTILEVAAGDGFLSQSLSFLLPKHHLIATDSGAWANPLARMSVEDRFEFEGLPVSSLNPGSNVKRLNATGAIKQYQPDLVLVSWAPPGTLIERLIKSKVKYVLEIGVEGDVCGNGWYTNRFANESLYWLETRALCRLDNTPTKNRHTRIKLYYGKAHSQYYEER